MQSVLIYGRLLTRALVNGVNCYSSTPRCRGSVAVEQPASSSSVLEPHLVTVWSGFPKDFSHCVPLRRGLFGDDAFFIAGHRAVDVLGVADGVGGWRTYGIDPSLFSGSLMQTCERLINLGRFNPRLPTSIIAGSYNELTEHKQQIIGSSTVCVVVLNKADGKMYTANIGDSGFLVVRRGKVVHRSEEQQHYFNTPFQLALAPPGQNGNILSDSPESADTSQFSVRNGDLILLATDGLFDNMPDSMIIAELSKLRDFNAESMQRTANSIALQARRLAFDANYMSPFAVRARENGIEATGGKPDDITVLLATVNM